MLVCKKHTLFNPVTRSPGSDWWTDAAAGCYRLGVRERNRLRSIGLEAHQGLLIVADSEASSALIVSLLACGKDNSHRQRLMNLTSVLLRKHRQLIAFDYWGLCVGVCVCVYICAGVWLRMRHMWKCLLVFICLTGYRGRRKSDQDVKHLKVKNKS